MGDSLSNASASLTNNVEDGDSDDEKTSQVRESLKRELKLIQVAKADLKVGKRKKNHIQSSHTIVNQPSGNEELYEEVSSMKQKLFEKNCRIQFLEKQSLKDKAELDAKDRLIDTEVSNSELLQKKLEEAEEKNRQLEELLEQKATDSQNISIFVSKILKEHFLDYESHTVTQPALEKKLEILDKHLQKSGIASKQARGRSGQRSSANNLNTQPHNSSVDKRCGNGATPSTYASNRNPPRPVSAANKKAQ